MVNEISRALFYYGVPEPTTVKVTDPSGKMKIKLSLEGQQVSLKSNLPDMLWIYSSWHIDDYSQYTYGGPSFYNRYAALKLLGLMEKFNKASIVTKKIDQIPAKGKKLVAYLKMCFTNNDKRIREEFYKRVRGFFNKPKALAKMRRLLDYAARLGKESEHPIPEHRQRTELSISEARRIAEVLRIVDSNLSPNTFTETEIDSAMAYLYHDFRDNLINEIPSKKYYEPILERAARLLFPNNRIPKRPQQLPPWPRRRR